ncbi:MAG: transglutaminase domain-containing protein [Candidatus Thermoplasmatota archaeon]
MGVRVAVGGALVAVALLGFTVAVPQNATLGVRLPIEELFRDGFTGIDGDPVGIGDQDVGDLLDRIDGAGLDPNLARNIDPRALADLLDGLSADELRALGLSDEEARALAERLRDPNLSDEELAAIAAGLAAKGLAFANADADGRFDAGEAAYLDVDGDGEVSAGDLRLGILALLLGVDRGLSDEGRTLFAAYQVAGAAGLQRPATANDRANATAGTASLTVPGYPSDRAIGPAPVVCVQLYTPSLTCHTRTFVQGRITKQEGSYLFLLDSKRTPVVVEPQPAGPRSSGTLTLDLDSTFWTPVPTLTPGDKLVAMDRSDVKLARDANGMLWARGPDGPVTLSLTWAVDLSYFDLPPEPQARSQDVPEALRPSLDSATLAIGLRIADLAGASGRPLVQGIEAIARFARGFESGLLPDRDERSDDLLAVAESATGCARHRAELFTLAAQALGAPARLVLNEAHAFAEVFVPNTGWHLVDLGACGSLQVKPLALHKEILAWHDLPYAAGDAPTSDASGTSVATAITITESPTQLRRNIDFTIAGEVSSPSGALPAGIPITFTTNRTKESPGTPFCSAATQAGGTYRATCQLGPGTPAGSLQLVARLAPAVVAGAPSLPSYSDPPFTLQKATSLSISGPTRTSADVLGAYTVSVVDEDGAPVAERTITLTVDGNTTLTRSTDATGRARFTFAVAVGGHTLAARFSGDDTYDASASSFGFQAVTARLSLSVDPVALDAGRLEVGGLLVPTSGSASGRPMRLVWNPTPDAEEILTVTTTTGGAFRAVFATPASPGPGLVAVRAPDGLGVDVAFARALDLQARLDVPERWATGQAIPVRVEVESGNEPVPLRILLDGGIAAVVTAAPDEPGRALVLAPAGSHILHLEAGEGVRLSAQPVQVVVGAAAILLQPTAATAPGGSLELRGTLTFDGAPIAGALRARILDQSFDGSAGSDGAFVLRLLLPSDAPPGEATLTLEAPDLGLQQTATLLVRRPANLAIEAPGLSLYAFGSTPMTVRGEGKVTVRADGEPLGSGGRIELPSSTFLIRWIDVEAKAEPSSPGLAPASAQLTVVVVNPAALLVLPLLFIAVLWFAIRTGRSLQSRRAHRSRFLPPRPASSIRIIEPQLPERAPFAFDPRLDRDLVVRMPNKGPWRVVDGLGRAVRMRQDGRQVTIALAPLPFGPVTLFFDDGRRRLRLDITLGDLRDALDAATVQLMTRIGADATWPLTLERLETGLRTRDARLEDAVRVRDAAERALYDPDGCNRDRFHSFFEALDEAQMPAKPGRRRA